MEGGRKMKKTSAGGCSEESRAKTQSRAVSLACCIVCMYCFGLLQSIRSLPEVNPKMALLSNHFLVDSENGKNVKNVGGSSSSGVEGGGKGGSIRGGGLSLNIAKNGLANVIIDGDDDADYYYDDDGKQDDAMEEVDDNVNEEYYTEEEELGEMLDDNEEGNENTKDDDDQKQEKKEDVVHIPEKPTIPKASWPVSVQTEKDKEQFVEIRHPGNDQVTMTVPQFWSPPIHNNEHMTRSTAMEIGSCAAPDSNGSHQRGDDCPMDDRTIFVAIASYRDWQCRYTVESIFQRAKHPHRIRVGVVDQIVKGEDEECQEAIEPCSTHPNQALCQYKDQIDVYTVDAPLAVGPVFARHLGHRLYRGEYYAMQSDAHVTFTQDWDTDIIQQQESTKNEMAVLSTYLTDVVDSIDTKTGKSLRNTRPIMCNTDYEGGVQGSHLRHLSQPEFKPLITGTPQLQPYWAAGFSFSRGHFVVNVPYDLYQPMIFQGEEMSIGIRGFTIGYDYYAPERSVCFHHYAQGANAAARQKVKHFWENSNTYAGKGKLAMARLLGIVDMNPEVDPSTWNHIEEDVYGIGKVRTTQKFYDTFGIHVKEKTTEHKLCSFVEHGKMHKLFTQHLRFDGMGIDYGKIDYQFKEP